jgi:sulfur relay protein TusC/DsrF
VSHILFIIDSTADDDALVRESHDLIMASTAYGHTASVFFTQAGVKQLLDGNAALTGINTAAKRINAFEFYDVEPLYVDQASLNRQGIKTEQIIEAVKVIGESEFAELSEHADLLIYC